MIQSGLRRVVSCIHLQVQHLVARLLTVLRLVGEPIKHGILLNDHVMDALIFAQVHRHWSLK